MDLKEIVYTYMQNLEEAVKKISKLTVAEIEEFIMESITKYPQENEIRNMLRESIKVEIKTWKTIDIESYVFKTDEPIEYIKEALSREDCSLKGLVDIYLFSKEKYPLKHTNLNSGFTKHLEKHTYDEIRKKYLENLDSHRFCCQLNLKILTEMIKSEIETKRDSKTIFDEQFEKNYLPGMRLISPFLKK